MERVLIAILVAGLGFITGILTVYTISRLPGVIMSSFIYLSVATILAFISGLYGFLNMEKALDKLGKIWDLIGVAYSIFRKIRWVSGN